MPCGFSSVSFQNGCCVKGLWVLPIPMWLHSYIKYTLNCKLDSFSNRRWDVLLLLHVGGSADSVNTLNFQIKTKIQLLDTILMSANPSVTYFQHLCMQYCLTHGSQTVYTSRGEKNVCRKWVIFVMLLLKSVAPWGFKPESQALLSRYSF